MVTFNVPGFRIIRFIIIVLVLSNIITWFKKYLHNMSTDDSFSNKIIYYSGIIKSVKLAA